MNVLVLYAATDAPLRTAISDHLRGFESLEGVQPIYCNVAVRRLPRLLQRLRFDLVVFHTTLLGGRWNRQRFARLTDRLEALETDGAVRVAFPQDEFLNVDLLETFFQRLGVHHVFSCASADQWPRIYPGLQQDGTKFHRVLTGYLSTATLRRLAELRGQVSSRPIDISYRAWRAEPWLGSLGRLKVDIGTMTESLARELGYRTDISLRAQDTLLGDAWFRLLLRSRWTPGVEGGATILDRDGRLRATTQRYLEAHPGATPEEVAEHALEGMEGTLDLRAISPRHLEACATRTGQLLVEGDYNGVLVANRHYLPIHRNLDNLQDVLEQLPDERLRCDLTESAFADVVESGDYSYLNFARSVLGVALGPEKAERATSDPGARSLASKILKWEDTATWPWVRARAMMRDALRAGTRAIGRT